MLGLALAKTLNRLIQVLAGRQQMYGTLWRQVRIEALSVIKMRVQPANQRTNRQWKGTPHGAQKQAPA